MDSQANNREITGRTQVLLWLLGGEGVKTTEKQNTLAPLEQGVGEQRGLRSLALLLPTSGTVFVKMFCNNIYLYSPTQ
jgi:hypothetical protein